MLPSLARFLLRGPPRQGFTALRESSTATSTNASASSPPGAPASAAALPSIRVSKRNLTQSPLRVKFLLTLVRGAWVPDALAQLKFSAKHKAVDVAGMIKRASTILKIRHDLNPAELLVKEIAVTKGRQQKQMTIMGRGRTGFGYRRWSHVWVKVEKIDFAKEIAEAKTFSQQQKWREMEALVSRMRQNPEQYLVQPNPSRKRNFPTRDAYDKPMPPRSR